MHEAASEMSQTRDVGMSTDWFPKYMGIPPVVIDALYNVS
jgi:hypothetical protein